MEDGPLDLRSSRLFAMALLFVIPPNAFGGIQNQQDLLLSEGTSNGLHYIIFRLPSTPLDLIRNACHTPFTMSQTIYTCLKQLRDEFDLTQAALAKKVDTSRQTVCAMEKGDYIPSLKLALLIAGVFKRPVESVFHLGKKKCG